MEDEQNPPAAEPDDFDRQLRALTSGQAGEAKFKELSADERARQAQKARRAGAKQAAKQRRAAARQAGRAGQASRAGEAREGGRAGEAREGGRAGRAGPGRPGRWAARSVARTVVTLVVLGLLASALYALGLRPGFLRRTNVPTPGNSGQRRSSALPGLPVTPAFTAADPFAGTPAEHYADGAAAITLPVDHPVGGYTVAQVATAYSLTRRLLIAADLDQATLNGGPPSAFAALLAPQLRTYFLRNLNRRGAVTRGYAASTRSWVVSFAPGTTVLVGSVIKVYGIMFATTGVYSGRSVLRVSFDFVFVYPVQRPGQPVTRMRLVAQQVGDADFTQWDDPGGPLQAWWVPGGGAGVAGARCDILDGYVHPAFPRSAPDKVRPTGAPINPYALNPPAHTGCQATTGT